MYFMDVIELKSYIESVYTQNLVSEQLHNLYISFFVYLNIFFLTFIIFIKQPIQSLSVIGGLVYT